MQWQFLGDVKCQMSNVRCQMSVANCELPTFEAYVLSLECHVLSIILIEYWHTSLLAVVSDKYE